MLVSCPRFCREFRCIAGDCPDTCCAKWEIVVDEASARRYRAAGGEIGDRLRQAMYEDDEGDTVFKNKNGRCPFLNPDNLCDIYSALGEKALCRTCERFPRYSVSFGGYEERGLSMSCPEAARLIIENGFDFETELDDRDPDINELDAELYFLLKSERDKIARFVQDGVNVNKLSGLIEYSKKLRDFCKNPRGSAPKLTKGGALEGAILPKKPELLSEKGKALEGLRFEGQALGEYSRNIFLYYLYRYFLASVYDGEVALPLRLAVAAVLSAAALPFSIVENAVLFSREIEHSESNLRMFGE